MIAGTLHAGKLNKDDALKVVTPLYSFFNGKTSADDVRLSFDPNYKSFSGHGENEYKSQNALIGKFQSFLYKAIPDLKWEIKDAFISGNRVIVIGEASGTPAGERFMGVPVVNGNSFKIMSTDIHTIKNGKIVKTYHIENWVGAIQQLSTKKK